MRTFIRCSSADEIEILNDSQSNNGNAMKFAALNVLLLVGLGIIGVPASGQVVRPEETLAVTSRGPHQRVWQRVERRALPNGRFVDQVKGYTEIANGLHYEKDGQWLETQEIFELFQDGAIARHGPYQVMLAPNLNSPTAVDLLSPGGKRFQSTVLGWDFTTAPRVTVNSLQKPEAASENCTLPTRFYTGARSVESKPTFDIRIGKADLSRMLFYVKDLRFRPISTNSPPGLSVGPNSPPRRFLNEPQERGREWKTNPSGSESSGSVPARRSRLMPGWTPRPFQSPRNGCSYKGGRFS
jgi:hypothetical protein